MEWQTSLALSVNAIGTAAAIFICLPWNRKRVSGFWIGFTAVMGILGGLLCISSVPVFSGDTSEGFPFDPRKPTGALFGRLVLFEDFSVGVAIPFILLALALAVIPEGQRRKQR